MLPQEVHLEDKLVWTKLDNLPFDSIVDINLVLILPVH